MCVLRPPNKGYQATIKFLFDSHQIVATVVRVHRGYSGQWFELVYAKDDSPHLRIFIEAHPDTDHDCMLNMAAFPSERVTTGSEGRTKQVLCQSFASHLIKKEISAA